MNKILILICYYNRPNLVRFALNSVKQQEFKNWEICFVDDGSETSAYKAILDVLGDEAHKLTYYNTNHTQFDKDKHGGSIFGLYWTLACQETDADIGIMLCDDDALVPGYLQKINDFFSTEKANWGYSHFLGYDPYNQKNFDEIIITERCGQMTTDCNPDSVLDASQVAFSLKAFKENNVEFAYPCTANLDAYLYRSLFPIYGGCKFMGCHGQYKGVAKNRLNVRQVDPKIIYSKDIDIDIEPFK
jgi:glycosyltransferase involved in cell wall biosynthesis